MKICFATEVTYPNYVNRIKQSSLKGFLDKKLEEFGIHYYISTNIPNSFSEYSQNESVKIFDVEQLRKGHGKSIKYELLPEDPTGLYPSKYPWNLRRFIVEKAAMDGFDYVIYVDADNVFHESLTGEDIFKELISRYESNSVQTNSTIFKYVNKAPDDVFNFHQLYIKHFNLDFKDDEYDTIDGPCQVFIGKTNQDILKFVNNWHKFTEFGYEKEFGYGYGNNKHGNLSFVIPISGFKLKWNSFPFYPNHVIEDRYTQQNKNIITQVIQPEEIVINENLNDDILSFFSKYSCDKVASGYYWEYEKIFSKFKNDPINFLEIGIGTVSSEPLEGMSSVPSSMKGWKDTNEGYLPGASLRSFRDYFKNGQIYGVDIQPDCMINEDRIKTFLFDSSEKDKCLDILKDLKFDVIIDDGNHDPNYQIKTLENLFERVNENGYYIIEDIVNYEFIDYYLSKIITTIILIIIIWQ